VDVTDRDPPGFAAPTHDCAIGEAAFREVTTPRVVDGQRVAALRFADPRVQAGG
jgi:hypothetical protein